MSKLFDDSSLAMIPTAVKDGKLYSIRPTPEYGAEEITNGNFATDSDWVKSPAGLTISGGFANFTSGQDTYVFQDIMTIGKQYSIVLEYNISSLTGSAYFGSNGGSSDAVINMSGLTGSGILSGYITASATKLIVRGAGINGNVTNVSVKEVLKPSGDFTFSRGSNLAATRVDVNGLIEKGRENLLLQSNQFDSSNWDKVGITETSGQSGYDGTNNAWLITKTSASYERIRQNNTSSGVLTASVYAKANTLYQATIYCFLSGSNAYAKFSLVDGSVVSSSSIIDTSATDVGNDWWRLSITFNDTLQSINIYPDLEETNAGSIYIQDAQLESGLVSTSVIETGASTAQSGILEDLPRLDYSGSCPSLLLEPQRSNRFTNSEYLEGFTKSSSGTASNPVVTSNYAISPEGVQNATRVQFDSGAGGTSSDASRIYQSFTIFGGTHTMSVYLKSNDGATHSISLVMTNSEVKIVEVTNEWQRFDATQVNTSPDNYGIGLYGDNGESADILVYGFQLEQASYPTSYIPTNGSAVTRSFDNMNNQAIVGDLSNNYTFFFDAVRLLDGDETQRWFYTTGLNGTNLQIYFISGGIDGRIRLFFRAAGGSSDSSITWELGPQEGSRYKIAIVRSEGSLKLFADGSLIGENTSNVPDELTYYNVFAGNGAQRLNQYLIFPTALTDSECIALTSL